MQIAGTPYGNSYGGVDPVRPNDRGAWANQKTTDEFNLYSRSG
jgi:hypothetical protein